MLNCASNISHFYIWFFVWDLVLFNARIHNPVILGRWAPKVIFSVNSPILPVLFLEFTFLKYSIVKWTEKNMMALKVKQKIEKLSFACFSHWQIQDFLLLPRLKNDPMLSLYDTHCLHVTRQIIPYAFFLAEVNHPWPISMYVFVLIMTSSVTCPQ